MKRNYFIKTTFGMLLATFVLCLGNAFAYPPGKDDDARKDGGNSSGNVVLPGINSFLSGPTLNLSNLNAAEPTEEINTRPFPRFTPPPLQRPSQPLPVPVLHTVASSPIEMNNQPFPRFLPPPLRVSEQQESAPGIYQSENSARQFANDLIVIHALNSAGLTNNPETASKYQYKKTPKQMRAEAQNVKNRLGSFDFRKSVAHKRLQQNFGRDLSMKELIDIINALSAYLNTKGIVLPKLDRFEKRSYPLLIKYIEDNSNVIFPHLPNIKLCDENYNPLSLALPQD